VIPAAELRPSPWAAPSQPPLAKLSLPLELPASARAKPPSLGPRTGPPAASRRQASPAAGSSPSLGRFATPSGRDAVSPPPPRARGPGGPHPSPHPPRPAAVSPPPPPPPALAGKWAHSNAVTLAAAPSPPRSWAATGPKALQRARSRPGWAKSRVPSPGKRNSLFFFFFHPFPHLNSFLNILCTKNYQKGFPRLHTIMLLENDTL
jgi:hypothetical protein